MASTNKKPTPAELAAKWSLEQSKRKETLRIEGNLKAAATASNNSSPHNTSTRRSRWDADDHHRTRETDPSEPPTRRSRSLERTRRGSRLFDDFQDKHYNSASPHGKRARDSGGGHSSGGHDVQPESLFNTSSKQRRSTQGAYGGSSSPRSPHAAAAGGSSRSGGSQHMPSPLSGYAAARLALPSTSLAAAASHPGQQLGPELQQQHYLKPAIQPPSQQVDRQAIYSSGASLAASSLFSDLANMLARRGADLPAFDAKAVGVAGAGALPSGHYMLQGAGGSCNNRPQVGMSLRPSCTGSLQAAPMDNALATAAAAAAAALRLNQSLALTPGGYILQPTTQTTENAQLLLQLPQARIQPPGLLPPSAGSTFHFARILGAAGSQQQPVAASHAAASRLGTSTHGNGSTRTRQSGWDVLPKPQQQQQHSSQGTRGVEGEGGRGSLWDQQQQPPHRGFGMLEVSVNPSLSGHPDSSTQGYGTTESGDSKIPFDETAGPKGDGANLPSAIARVQRTTPKLGKANDLKPFSAATLQALNDCRTSNKWLSHASDSSANVLGAMEEEAVNALLLDAGGGTHPLSLTFMDVKGGGVIGSGTFGCVLEFQLYSDPDGMLDINRTHTQHRQQCQAEQLWLEQINDFKKERLVIKVPEQPDELQLPSQQLSRDTAGRQLSRLLGGRQSIQLPLEQLQQHNTRAMPIPPKLHALWHEFCVLVSLEKEDFTCRPLGVVLMPLPLDPEGPGPAAADTALHVGILMPRYMGTLHRYIELFSRVKGRSLLSYEAGLLLTQLLLALRSYHSHGLIHQDVKPQGVSTSVEFKELFGKRRTEPGEGLGDLLPHQLGIFLCDGGSAFDGGLSRAPDKPGCGSPYYMASELLTAAGYTEVVDVYSAGITYTEMKGIELNSAEYQGKKGKALLDALKLHKQHSGLTDPELEMLGYMLSPARGPPHSTTRWSAQQLLERCPLVVQFVELHNQLGDRLTRSQAVQRLDTLAEQEQQQQAAARAVLGRGRRR